MKTRWQWSPCCTVAAVRGSSLPSSAEDLSGSDGHDRKESRRTGRTRIPFHFFAQHNRFRNFFHRLALLAALPLERQVGLFFAQSKIALQNPFGAFHNFSRLQLF